MWGVGFRVPGFLDAAFPRLDALAEPPDVWLAPWRQHAGFSDVGLWFRAGGISAIN